MSYFSHHFQLALMSVCCLPAFGVAISMRGPSPNPGIAHGCSLIAWVRLTTSIQAHREGDSLRLTVVNDYCGDV